MCESNSGDEQLSIFPSYPTPTSDPHFSWTLQGTGKTPKKRFCAVSTTSLGYEASEKSQAHGSLPF